MNFSISGSSRVAASSLVLLLAGCSFGSPGNRLAGAGLQAPQAQVTGSLSNKTRRPPPCIPRVWSNNGAFQVVGYNSAGAICLTLTGAAGLNFDQVSGLATDRQGYLYVADTFNNRVVVFDSSGNYWSTLNTPDPAPIGVCVKYAADPGVVVGVVFNNPTGNIEFFNNRGAQNSVSSPSNTTPVYPYSNRFCAFDKHGDFFATGPGQGPISYLRFSNVNQPGVTVQACSVPSCSTATHTWFGMYSHIQGVTRILSVEDLNAVDIANFEVRTVPGSNTLLSFTPWTTQPTTALSGYNATFYMCPAAPSHGQGNSSRIYLADGSATNLDQVANVQTGGPVTVFASNVGACGGVATYPTGQY